MVIGASRIHQLQGGIAAAYLIVQRQHDRILGHWMEVRTMAGWTEYCQLDWLVLVAVAVVGVVAYVLELAVVGMEQEGWPRLKQKQKQKHLAGTTAEFASCVAAVVDSTAAACLVVV